MQQSRRTSVNVAAQNRAQSRKKRWCARAAVVIALLSLQLAWIGVFVCAARCAHGACAPPQSAAAAQLPADHCEHSGATPAAPAKRSGDTSHHRHCPVSNLRFWNAAARADGALQSLVSPSTMATVAFSSALSSAIPGSADAVFRLENSPPVIVSFPSSLPLRI
jgi:hypothetical protein